MVTIDVVGVGARTPLGLRAAAAASAVRGGLSALKRHPFLVDSVGELMPAALDVQLDPRLLGAKRLLALLQPALVEACAALGTTGSAAPRIGIHVGLPELRPGFTHEDAMAVRAGVARLAGLPAAIGEVEVFTLGHAAGLVALARACERIGQGAFDACLVCGVDSYFHPYTMEWLDANRQLLGKVSRSGFVPGEGAGACLLLAEPARARLGLPALMRIRDVAVGRETCLIKSPQACFGHGLTTTVRQAVRGLRASEEVVSQVICDMNGERYRGEEWGFVCLRTSAAFDDPTAYLSPAEGWGDVGAASGPLFVMLACAAVERGYAKGPLALLWASSEGGCRAAALLAAS